MKILKDCSEIQEARDLLLKIMTGPATVRPPEPTSASEGHRSTETTEPLPPLDEETREPASSFASGPGPRLDEPARPREPEGHTPLEALVSEPPPPAPGPTDPGESPTDAPSEPAVDEPDPSRGSRLQQILAQLCAHDGFTGAMVTDGNGLPLAISSSPDASNNLATFATVLGDALSKAGSYFGQDEAGSVSLDINDQEKAVLRRFPFEGQPYYLLALCLQDVEARRELDRAVPEIAAALAAC